MTGRPVTIPITMTDGGKEQSEGQTPTDTGRINHLLQQHDGRMRQAKIVESTGWSKAKVSDLLADMNESDRIEKLQLGRENIICLPDAKPDGTESPYDL